MHKLKEVAYLIKGFLKNSLPQKIMTGLQELKVLCSFHCSNMGKPTSVIFDVKDLSGKLGWKSHEPKKCKGFGNPGRKKIHLTAARKKLQMKIFLKDLGSRK